MEYYDKPTLAMSEQRSLPQTEQLCQGDQSPPARALATHWALQLQLQLYSRLTLPCCQRKGSQLASEEGLLSGVLVSVR